MNTRRLTIALTFALAISALCTWFLSRKLAHPVAAAQRTQSVVAPSRPIDAGETLKLADLELIDWPAALALPNSFAKPEDLIGRAALYPISKDQPILAPYLAAAGAGAGIAARIPVGMRAIALHSDEVMGVAGFLAPGSHLDVLVTFRSATASEPATATVLQDAEVLAAGNRTQPDPAGKPETVTVVTLLLTPQDAERAVMASTQGNIHFVLRGPADKSRTPDSPISLSQLSNTLAPAPARTAPQKISLPHPHSTLVETITADKP